MDSNKYIKSVTLRENQDHEGISKRLQDKGTVRLLHAMIGMATEAGEFQDMIKKHLIYGKPIDRVNLAEELGDQLWYIGLALDELGLTFEEVMAKNNEKLAARYGDVFTEEAALNRNLKEEREILESE